MRSVLAGLLLFAPGLASADGRIVIDGDLSDWSGAEPNVTQSAQDGPIQIRSLTVCHDLESIFLRLELDRTVNLQTLGRPLTLAIDQDLNGDTGKPVGDLEGVDLSVDFSPFRPRYKAYYGAQIRLQESGQTLTAHQAELFMAPTVSSSAFEIRLPRRTDDFALHGDGFRIQASMDGGALAPVEYRYAEHAALAERRSDPQGLDRSPDTLRVLSWNIGDNYFHRRFERYRHTVRLLQPDVLMFDEAPRDVSKDQIRQLIGAFDADPEAWSVIIGQGGGRQRGVLAARAPLAELGAFSKLRYSDDTLQFIQKYGSPRMTSDLGRARQEGMPVAGAAMEWQGRSLYLVVMDFQCCGRDGSPEDRFRVQQASLVGEALERSMAESAPHAVILGGDLNLVGSRLPLTVLEQIGQDIDQGALTTLAPMQLDRLSNTTYVAPGPFTPGRLDFVLHSTPELTATRAFIFDTRDLPPDVLADSGLAPGDSVQTSDHLPVVVDFALSP